jgi:molybdate transport system ATP-binding protein
VNLDAAVDLTQGSFRLKVELPVAAGTTTAVLGPNGAGKSTLLRVLAGSTAIDAGHVRLGDRPLDEPARRVFVPTEARRVGLVHQELLLFPHLSVLDNVAFGPRCAGRRRAEARAMARTWLERVGLAETADAMPRSLSGGQAQRVALARVLVTEPDLLLLDEPLSALDAGTRGVTRRDLRRYLDGFAGATVLVTHDPLDALALADRVVVLEAGLVTQGGPIGEITAHPRTRYVADLVGTNLLVGDAHERTVTVGTAAVSLAEPLDGAAFATISPSAVTISHHQPEGSARNAWPVNIAGIEHLGERVRLALEGPPDLVAEITTASLLALSLSVGDAVWAPVKSTDIAAYLR